MRTVKLTMDEFISKFSREEFNKIAKLHKHELIGDTIITLNSKLILEGNCHSGTCSNCSGISCCLIELPEKYVVEETIQEYKDGTVLLVLKRDDPTAKEIEGTVITQYGRRGISFGREFSFLDYFLEKYVVISEVKPKLYTIDDIFRISKIIKNETMICTAPTQSLLQKWLREVHEIYCSADIFVDCTTDVDRFESNITWSGYTEEDETYFLPENCFDTYELALEDSLYAALKLI